MIKRDLTKKLKFLAEKLPVLAILGPRQSGKTTLSQAAFPKHTYVSLEDLEAQEFAKTDPRGFLNKHANKHGIILDEIQHVPALLSYIQVQVDREKKNGYFILTGSQDFLSIKQLLKPLLVELLFLHSCHFP